MVQHWSDLTSDPNSREAIRFRRERLAAAHTAPVRSRDEYIASLASGRKVLDVGCVDHLAPTAAIAPLHRRLARATDDLFGVDLSRSGIDQLRAEGFRVDVADVTVPGLDQVTGTGYDLVVAGEIIEHLLDLSPFLANMRAVLGPAGRLVMSTPNPHSLYVAGHTLFGAARDSVDHVTFHFPSGIAELADRTGWDLLEIRGERRLVARRLLPSYVLGRAVSALAPRSNAECVSLIYVLGLKP